MFVLKEKHFILEIVWDPLWLQQVLSGPSEASEPEAAQEPSAT